MIVLLPGITGSVLQKDGHDVWALSGGALGQALKSFGRSIGALELHGDDPDVDDLEDGITAPRVIPGTHLVPGLWKIDGYGKLSRTILHELDVTPGMNFFEFPYDWRRDNRVHARRLARQSRAWLSDWRKRSGHADAKLILIGHSMGGLISRYFLELHDGWRDTRLLITFGTPYRGSVNALGFLANGLKKRLGPVTLLNLTSLMASFTSVYQMLPVYPCVGQGDGALERVTEVAGISGVDPSKAAAALAFHDAIRTAVEDHRKCQGYLDHGYKIRPVAGIFQPTSQSALLRGDGTLKVLRTYNGQDQGGDGTVPSVSATPIELSNQDLEVYACEKHASLQNGDFSLAQVIGLLRRQQIDQTQAFAPGGGISVAVEDAYLWGEEIVVSALPESEFETLTATVHDAGSDERVASVGLREGDDGWHAGAIAPLPEGTYRVAVHGAHDGNSVTDVFVVVAEGTDVELA